MQRIKNLEKAIVDEDNVDWSGHSVDLRSVMDTSESTLPQLDPAMPISFSHTDPTVPMSNTKESLIRLRRLNTWHKRMEKFMEDRLRSLQGASAEKEFQCKKILALSTGIPFENIEEVKFCCLFITTLTITICRCWIISWSRWKAKLKFLISVVFQVSCKRYACSASPEGVAHSHLDDLSVGQERCYLISYECLSPLFSLLFYYAASFFAFSRAVCIC